MNRQDLAKIIAEKGQISNAASERVLKALIDAVTEEVVKGGMVQLVGFGTFKLANRAARKGVNPQSGAEMKIPACKVPSFKASSVWKDACNAAKKK